MSLSEQSVRRVKDSSPNKVRVEDLFFRNAVAEDLPRILELVADIIVSEDQMTYANEIVSDPPVDTYVQAFRAILAPPNQAIVSVLEGKIVGYFQISFIQGLTRRGGKRAIVEDVRVCRSVRGQDVGRWLMERAVAAAREHGCWVIQLTTNKWREEAIAFYEKIGFQRSHEGFRIQF